MRRFERVARRAQRGVILFIALIVLVAMSLAGIALMRSVDTNVLIAGNLAFRQSGTMLADAGIEAARAWLNSNTTQLSNNQPGGFTAYWASWGAGLDFIKATAATTDDYDWSTAQSVASPDPAYDILYVIHRMCEGTGDPATAGATCMKSTTLAGSSASGAGSKGVVTYGSQTLPGTSAVFYRVTVRVTGPRNTRGFVQALLN
ncbi:MAG: hypothetical protein OEW21_03135 [Betaproteobacteria bacterium]|nr:hypothetical protein [Betaproteobacteria bacterium]